MHQSQLVLRFIVFSCFLCFFFFQKNELVSVCRKGISAGSNNVSRCGEKPLARGRGSRDSQLALLLTQQGEDIWAHWHSTMPCLKIQRCAVCCHVWGNLFLHQLQSRFVPLLGLVELSKQFGHDWHFNVRRCSTFLWICCLSRVVSVASSCRFKWQMQYY